MAFLSNLKISAKITGLLISICALGFLGLAAMSFQYKRTDTVYSAYLEHDAVATVRLARANGGLSRALATAYTFAEDPANSRAELANLDQIATGIDSAFEKSIAGLPQYSSEITEFRNRASTVVAKIQTAVQGAESQSVQAITAKLLALDNEIDLLSDDLASFNDKTIDRLVQSSSDLTDQTHFTIATTSGAVLVFMMLGLGIGIFVSKKGVSQPLERLRGAMLAIADNDLDVTVAGTDRRDEVGDMARTVLVFLDSARKVQALTAAEAARIIEAEQDRRAMMVELQTAFGDVVDAALEGRFDRKVAETFADKELNDLAKSLNALIQTVETGLHATRMVLSSLAASDLTKRVHGDFKGAFEELKNDTNSVADRLNDTIGQLQSTSGSLRVATSEILSGANDLSERTSKQAAAIEQTSAAMEQLTSTVAKNAERAQSAQENASDVARLATDGEQVMAAANSAMDRISQSSTRISDIIGLIDDIAFQTNLLALNASVEAARAGDAGKGFAVVAVEVRRLAQSAASASADVKSLIEQSATEVRNGSKLVSEASLKLKSMTDGIGANAQLISAIAQDSIEQSSALREVSIAVRQMDEMTQHNAALVEQTNAAIEQSDTQVAAIDGIVENFVITSSHTNTNKKEHKPLRAMGQKFSVSGNTALASHRQDWSEF